MDGTAEALGGSSQNARWPEALTAAAVWDQAHAADTPIRNREMARVVAIAQKGAGAWLEIAPDGTYGTRIDSDDFPIAIQRRYGLRISMVAVAAANNDVLAAAAGAVEHT